MKKLREGNQREKLITAAEAVVLRHGANTLTLEAVAAEAKVSKGGLLYHFPSKRTLIEAMVERLIQNFQADLDQAMAAAPAAAGRFTRALVQLVLERPAATLERELRMSAALLAAAANEPDLLIPLRQAYGRWMAAARNDGLPEGRAMTVFAALDGIWFWALSGVWQPSRGELHAMRAILKGLIAE